MKFSSRDLPDGTISSSELKLHRLAGSLNKGQRVVTAPLLRAKPDQAGSLNIGEKGGESGSAGRVGRSGVPRPGMNPQVGRRARWWPSACAPTHIHQHHLTKQHTLGVKLNRSVNCSRRLPCRVERRLWSVVWRQVNAVCSLCVGRVDCCGRARNPIHQRYLAELNRVCGSARRGETARHR